MLGVLFGIEWVALAINPRDRQDWALENALSVAFVAALVTDNRSYVIYAPRDKLPALSTFAIVDLLQVDGYLPRNALA